MLTNTTTSSVPHILTKFFLAKNQKIKHLQFQIRIPHGIRISPHPFSSQSDTSFARYGHLSVEVWGKLTFGDGSTIIAKFYSFELREAPPECPTGSPRQPVARKLLSCILPVVTLTSRQRSLYVEAGMRVWRS